MSVQTHLQSIASGLVLSSDERFSIDISISTLKLRLIDYFQIELKEQLRFGSSTRGTILPRKADPNSDIDYMIMFDNLEKYKPQTFIDRLKRFAEDKYSTSEIHQRYPTIILELNHIKFDLVPAYRSWDGIQIPSPSANYFDWISTDPNGFNHILNQKHSNNDYLIKPVIRLLKYWNAENYYIYKSYDLEQHLVNHIYYCSNLREYFYSAVDSLDTWNLSQTNTNKVNKAKQTIKKAKQFETDGMPTASEIEIKKLIPEL